LETSKLKDQRKDDLMGYRPLGASKAKYTPPTRLSCRVQSHLRCILGFSKLLNMMTVPETRRLVQNKQWKLFV